MPTIFISGAASGIGLAFVQAYSTDTSNMIIAVDKSPIPSQCSESKVRTFAVDVASQHSINSLALELKDMPIDLLIHSAGIRGLVPSIVDERPNDVAAAETLEAMDIDTLMRTFQTNAAGTFMMIRALLPNLRLSTLETPKVVIMSSRMGSMSYNKSAGGAYAYRASKSALNAIVRSFSIDVPNIIFTMIHPGRVESGLTKCREEGAIEADESVDDMLPLITHLGKEASGRFFDRFGGEIGW
ncbi:MAG: hypothetical protein M1834_004693 [Cirrosporium novae-zelandiae]|nr:MAG: hypothetical protein M1834_004693 [Cirrosporium novae-zelandiae]